MWGWITKAKNIYGWFKFAWEVVWGAIGWLGLAPLLTGLVITVIAVAGAFFRALPWPFIVMGAFCMLVGAIYLAMAPLAFKILIVARDATKAIAAAALASDVGAGKPKKQLVYVHYEPWSHVDQFTVREAAFLWNDLEPSVSSNLTSEVAAWIEALQAAIRKGEIKFKPRRANDRQAIEYERQNPDVNTVVYRESLIEFAGRHGYGPKFLIDPLS